MSTEKGIIKASDRHTIRSIKTAMQGDIIRALVEIITNGDDSYIRLKESNKEYSGKIEILYKKVGNICRFGIRDFAEGMSIETIRKSFKEFNADWLKDNYETIVV